jgi:hypothetical protein
MDDRMNNGGNAGENDVKTPVGLFIGLSVSVKLYVACILTFYIVQKDIIATIMFCLSVPAAAMSIYFGYMVSTERQFYPIHLLTISLATYVSIAPVKVWEFKSSLYHLEYQSGNARITANLLIERNPSHKMTGPPISLYTATTQARITEYAST